MLPNTITYPIINTTIEGTIRTITAGIKSVDEYKHVLYEGITLAVPNIGNISFAVLRVKQVSDKYELLLHAHSTPSEEYASTELPHIDISGDITATLTLSLDMMKKITGLTGRDIEAAYNTVHIGYTYNLLVCMPRIIEVHENEVIIVRSIAEPVDAYNVCNLLFKNEHPIDK